MVFKNPNRTRGEIVDRRRIWQATVDLQAPIYAYSWTAYTPFPPARNHGCVRRIRETTKAVWESDGSSKEWQKTTSSRSEMIVAENNGAARIVS